MSETKQILVVDDDLDLTRSVKAFLEGRGYAVRVAHSGAEGLEQLEQHRPDLIVLDIMMDHPTDGFNLAYSLKADESYRQIPIVILSGFTRQLDNQVETFEFILGRDWPAAAMLEKPAELKKLAATIEEILAERNEERGTRDED